LKAWLSGTLDGNVPRARRVGEVSEREYLATTWPDNVPSAGTGTPAAAFVGTGGTGGGGVTPESAAVPVPRAKGLSGATLPVGVARNAARAAWCEIWLPVLMSREREHDAAPLYRYGDASAEYDGSTMCGLQRPGGGRQPWGAASWGKSYRLMCVRCPGGQNDVHRVEQSDVDRDSRASPE
jgi:hypothetical protein